MGEPMEGDEAYAGDIQSSAPKKRSAPAAVQSEVNVHLEMEKVLEKLKLLNYESEFLPRYKIHSYLTRTYFAMPSANPHEQLICFNSLVAWLLEKLDRHFEFSVNGDPMATAGAIKQELEAVGLPNNFPPTKLRQGHGEVVVMILDSLLEAVLEKINFKFGRPSQRADEYDDVAPQDDEAELGDEIDDNLEIEEEEGLYMDGIASPGVEEQKEERPEVIEAAIDPAIWKLELERVAPQLKPNSADTDHKEWRTHLEQTKTEKEKIAKVLPETKGSLSQLAEEVEEHLKMVSDREGNINQRFDHKIRIYRDTMQETSVKKAEYEASVETNNMLSNNLSTISEELDDIKNQMDEQGSSMTDTSPVVKMKKALSQVKGDTKQMEVRIGVVQHVLHHAKMAKIKNPTPGDLLSGGGHDSGHDSGDD